MKSIGKIEAGLIHREIDAALKVIADKYGLLNIVSNKLTFNDMGFRLSIEGKVNAMDENGNITQTAKNSTVAYVLNSLGTPLNAIAFIDGKQYRVTGYTSRRPKMPIDLINVATSQPAKADARTVARGIDAYTRIIANKTRMQA